MDRQAVALFAEAEVGAERLVALFRMAAALALGAVFAVAVLSYAPHSEEVIAVQMSATIADYFVLGAVSFRFTIAQRFRS